MTTIRQTLAEPTSRRETIQRVAEAQHRHHALSTKGLSERLFTFAFSGLVYPQIWEDPRVDLDAMALEPGHDVIAIASGGCNVLSYLTAAPVSITAVDLNSAHVALNRLKVAAASELSSAEFQSMFRNAATADNLAIFDHRLAPVLDVATRAYWTARDWRGRRRIDAFATGFYRTGLLGRFIGLGHTLARVLGADPKLMMQARSLSDQRIIYERELKPLFERGSVRRLLNSPASLFGLGIPPAQYEALREGRPMHTVVQERLEKLCCDAPLSDNYFAWQAFNRGYGRDEAAPVPPYLEARHFDTLKQRVGAVDIVNAALDDVLANKPARCLDRYVLLDAQDWMTDAQLNVLWREITRTARPGARVIFRTAGRDTILPGRVRASLLDHWIYERAQSQALTAQDRSAIYGGFHVYRKAD